MKLYVLIGDVLLRAALFLTGAADAESLDESVLLRLEALEQRPLALNRASRSRLLSEGILTPYQVASLEEYRHLYGDVLSMAELSLVDGFGEKWTEIMAPFLSLAPSLSPLQRDTLVWTQTALLNTDLKAVRAKYRIASEKLLAGAAGRLDYDGKKSWTAHGAWFLPQGRLVAGDFNARFAQGLTLWTGFRLGGLESVEAFQLKGNGIVPSWSVSGDGTLRGVAGEWTPGKWRLGAFAGSPSQEEYWQKLHAGLYGRRIWRSGDAGFLASHVSGGWRLSLDGTFHFGQTTCFGEAAARYEDGTWAYAGLAGCRISVLDRDHLAFQLRVIPSRFSGKKNGEYAFAAGYAWSAASLTADYALVPQPGKDASRRQLKVYGLWSIPFRGGWSVKLRAYERWRSYERNRLDLRGEAAWESGAWTLRGRVNGVFCRKVGALGFVEGGWKDTAWTLFLRGTLFHVDEWDDRIYLYEHDAPGNFTVPACHGRGGLLSLYAAWKHRFSPAPQRSGRAITLRCGLRTAGMVRSEHTLSLSLRLQIQAEW